MPLRLVRFGDIGLVRFGDISLVRLGDIVVPVRVAMLARRGLHLDLVGERDGILAIRPVQREQIGLRFLVRRFRVRFRNVRRLASRCLADRHFADRHFADRRLVAPRPIIRCIVGGTARARLADRAHESGCAERRGRHACRGATEKADRSSRSTSAFLRPLLFGLAPAVSRLVVAPVFLA